MRRRHLGWGRFNELSGALCKRFTWKLKGMVYKACVRSVMAYGGETWNLKSVEDNILTRTEMAMIRGMCG